MSFEELSKSFKLKNLPGSEVELTGEVPAGELAAYRDAALAHIAAHMEMPGFRPGKVPKDIALKKAGEVAVLEEATELLVKDLYPALIEAHKTDAVGRPDIRVTKMPALPAGGPVALSVRVTVYPEVSPPKEWKTLHEKITLEPALPATGEEVDKTLEDLRASFAKATDGQAAALPALDDAFAKKVGAFENLETLKEQIKKGIGEEKARAARDVRRGRLIDKLLEGTEVVVPRLFVESELEKILAQMREDVQRFGLSFEDYLKQTNKTEENIRSDFKEQAAKRAKLQLVLNKIAQDEKMEADPAAVEAELKHALEHFPDANPEMVKVHVETVLRNEQILKLLEGETK